MGCVDGLLAYVEVVLEGCGMRSKDVGRGVVWSWMQ
jgi:hypothetical protein